MANQEQVKRLLQGVEDWNHWRQENPEVIPDLSGADLRDANLIGANFVGASLYSAKLDRANLAGANLRAAKLSEVKLSGATLTAANLICARLIRADLSGTKLNRANLGGANLGGVNLQGADLSGADLSNAQLDATPNLCYANLSGVNLTDAVIKRANLTGAIFDGATVKGALLEGVHGLTQRQMLDLQQRGAVIKKGPWHPARTAVFRQQLSMPDDISPELLFAEIFESLISMPPPTLEPVFCYMHAEMDEQVIVQRVTTVEVLLSKEPLDQVASNASQGGTAEIDETKHLTVQIIPKNNFVTVEADRTEVALPQTGQPLTLYFDLKATDEGEGEVWVVLRQAQQTLLTLTLRPKIVKNRAAVKAIAVNFLMTPMAAGAQKLKSSGTVNDVPQRVEPLHQLRIIEQQNGNQITYLYELNAPQLGVLSLHQSKPITSDRHAYIQNLYTEIESRWLNTQGAVEDFAAELRAFGGQLFDQLFPESLQRDLWTHRAQLNNIMVISTEPFIPWELVHLKPPGQNRLPNETWFLGQLGLVRWVHDVGFPPEHLTIRRGYYARYVIPNYPPESGYLLPQADHEREFLEQRFGALKVNANPASLRQILYSSDFDLLHFAGHGVAEQNNIGNASLLLEGQVTNGEYRPTLLSATTVEQYLKCDADHRPMVVLNACQLGREGHLLTGIGGFAQAFLKGGIGIFVGTLWSVGDRSARTFTETLYSCLLEGMTLSEATTQARQQTKESGNATWLAYVVYGHPHLKLTIDNANKKKLS